MGRSRYKVVQDQHTYFVTCAVLNWLPLFSHPELAQLVQVSLQHLYQEQRLALHAYVLLENHLHIVGSSTAFSAEMRSFKSFTARGIIDLLVERRAEYDLHPFRFLKKPHKENQTHQVWQEGFHPQAIVNDSMLKQKIEYVHLNPVRRGYVDYLEQWRYPSARQYFGHPGLIDIDLVM